MKLVDEDLKRYSSKKEMPKVQKYLRKYQDTEIRLIKIFYKVLYRYFRKTAHIEMDINTQIKGGLYIGHPYSITINPKVQIGKNCNIHKGVTIGQENRGKREGVPIIGNEVWIGINAVIVGGITIGDDVLIAPNAWVNCDVPDYSIVFGNPCTIKYNAYATEGYINRKI